VAVGDFNQDGNLDIAAADFAGTTVRVLLGNGGGGFAAAADVAAGQAPGAVAVGDFNRDGQADLVVANVGSNTLSVLLGNGDGTFQAAVDYAVGVSPRSVAVADFNHDGNPDLAVANLGSNTVSVLLGNGDGTFGPTVNLPVGVNPRSVAVGDFNGDGNPDLVVANAGSGTVSVLPGDGSGNFFAPANFAAGIFPSSVAVGDFNGDGKLDLAVANDVSSTGTVSVFVGDGLGGFAAPVSLTVGTDPVAVAVGDFNGDGNPDLAVANARSNTVGVLLGNGLGNFAAPVNFTVGTEPVAVAVADFNHDGHPDLAVANQFGSHGSVLLNQVSLTTTAVTSNNPAVYGQLVTFTAAVSTTEPTAAGMPTGVVTFKDGATTLGTGTLDALGHATLGTSALGTGYHAVTAVYQGDPNFTASTSPVLNQLVNQGATVTTVRASANPWVFGQPVTFTATVSAAGPGFGPPTGTVTFFDGPPIKREVLAALGTGTLSGGVATFTSTTLGPGSHQLFAVYGGDGNFTGSLSAALPEAVNNPVPAVTGLGTSSLPEGSPALTLTITGSNFVSGAVVQWNGTPLAVTALGGTQIQATVPASLLAEEGTAAITVSNPGPGGGSSLGQTFTITDAPLAAQAQNLNVLGNKNFSGVVATFSDARPGAAAGDFTAIITWDDGSATYGTIGGSGPFTVSGSHLFGGFKNVHAVTVTILDRGGSAVTVTDNVIDPAAPEVPQPAAEATAPAAPPKHHRRRRPPRRKGIARSGSAGRRHRHGTPSLRAPGPAGGSS
jgi:hypothetical protein